MSQFKHYAPVSDKQLGFYIDSSRCSGCKACQVACKDKKTLNPGVVSVVCTKSTAEISSQPARVASAITFLPTHFLSPATTVRILSAPKTARPPRCISVRVTASCASIRISASAVDIVRGHAPMARRSSTSRPGRCPNAIFAWICRRKANSLSAWQPVPLKRSNSGRLMNFGRNTVWSVT